MAQALQNLKRAQERQKNYADKKRRELVECAQDILVRILGRNVYVLI